MTTGATTTATSSSVIVASSSSSSSPATTTQQSDSSSSTTITTTSTTMPTIKDIIFCIISISLGTYIMITDISGFFTSSSISEDGGGGKTIMTSLPYQWMESCTQIHDIHPYNDLSLFSEEEFDLILTKKTEFGSQLPTLENYDPTFAIGFKVYKVTICILTQFINELLSSSGSKSSSSPEGFIIWMTTLLIWLPICVFMRIESCRVDAVGLIKYPTLLYISSQLSSGGLFFRSYLIPLFFIPAWILGRGNGQNDSSINKVQTLIILPIMVLPTIILSVLIFSIQNQYHQTTTTTTTIWISLIGLLGGPVLPLLNSIVSNIVATIFPSSSSSSSSSSPSDDQDQAQNNNNNNNNNLKIIKESNDRSSFIFVLTGMIALFGWLWIVFITTIPYYGFSFESIYNAILWPSSDNSQIVKFMTIEAIVLWLSGIIILAYHNFNAALEGIFMSLCFGPGSGISLVLAGLYVDDDVQLELAKQLKEKNKLKIMKNVKKKSSSEKKKADLGKED